MSTRNHQCITTDGGKLIGSIRFVSLSAESALQWRLRIDLRVSLDAIAGGVSYALTDIVGELRADQTGATLGRLHWRGCRPYVPCKPTGGHDGPLSLEMALEPWVLDRLEARRESGEPTLWLELAPRLEWERGGYIRSWVEPFPIAISRDDWHRVLAELGYAEYDLIELRIPIEHGDHIHIAAKHVRAAQQHLGRGLWFECLQETRFVCEALEAFLRPVDVKDFLKSSLAGQPGEAWAGIFSRLKTLSAVSHHLGGQGTRVLRAEARGAARLAASLVELVATLTAPSA